MCVCVCVHAFVLACVIGELVQVSGPQMAVYADDLFFTIIDMLQVCPVC